ncbi:MAG: hypothetical protein JXR41_09205, partial [Bacteroidales bacterium]|nr:hypothetical protein [Bacteroidales bacterium]
MKNPFLNSKGIKPGEAFIFSLSCIQALSIGAFLAIFDIGAHVIFFESYGSQMMPLAMAIAGIAGLIYMSFYSFFLNRINFRFFVSANYFIIMLILAVLFFYEPAHSATVYGIPLLLPFSLMFPVNIIVMLVFWRSTQKIYTSAQHRRLYPYLRAFQIGGMVASSLILLALFYFKWDRNL